MLIVLEASVALQPITAVVALVGWLGWEVKTTWGATVSAVQVSEAIEETLPAPSTARTRKVWEPSATLTVRGLVQGS